MLNLVFAESALETVPKSLWKHSSVTKQARRKGKKPRELLLDRSYHHFAMLSLREGWKRGRPNILHFALLEALNTPLNRAQYLKIYVHTINDDVLYINPKVRIPKSYVQFVGLIENLYVKEKIPSHVPTLLELKRKKTLHELINEIKSDYIVALTRKGKPKTLREVVSKAVNKKNPAVVIGGFPKGYFSEPLVKLVNETVSIDPEMLDAWTVTSRLIFTYELALGLPEIRLEYLRKK